MGFEYIYKISQQDHDAIAKGHLGIRDLEGIIRTSAEYIEKIEWGGMWKPNLSIHKDGLIICIYHRNGSSLEYFNYITGLLLRVCGHVEIYEA